MASNKRVLPGGPSYLGDEPGHGIIAAEGGRKKIKRVRYSGDSLVEEEEECDDEKGDVSCFLDLLHSEPLTEMPKQEPEPAQIININGNVRFESLINLPAIA